MPTYGTEIGTSGITTGWGHTEFSGNKTSTKSQMLKYLGVQVADISYCRSRLSREVYEKVLCVYPRLKYTRLAKVSKSVTKSAYALLYNTERINKIFEKDY